MDDTNTSEEARAVVLQDEDRSLQRALQLARKSSLRRLTMDELMARAPDDWQPGEADADEFLGSIRAGSYCR